MWTAYGVLCAALCLSWYIKVGRRDRAVKHELQKRECLRMGHDIHRIFAYNDPRFPVDRCRRCQRQWPVQYPCPHCGEELGTHGFRST